MDDETRVALLELRAGVAETKAAVAEARADLAVRFGALMDAIADLRREYHGHSHPDE